MFKVNLWTKLLNCSAVPIFINFRKITQSTHISKNGETQQVEVDWITVIEFSTRTSTPSTFVINKIDNNYLDTSEYINFNNVEMRPGSWNWS